ncbi:hypothetical protein MUK60_07390 [Streptomyces sp. LRE541]|uniref:hypothetical protein n=1 Tax=Streptomyces sp. LRE541 TaxID=2931983 RepID=UPI0020106BF2|nr:hypothetical protein [Streptomyces sp. LRE541]UPZ27656.1 hypothetical protein MUK60_07390 [Streptomyces sp. LRE541]
MTAPNQPRFVVEKHGPRDYYVFDTVTCLSRYPSFTRRGAQKIADRKNAEHPARDWDETPAEAARYDRAWDANDHDIHPDEE